MGRNGVESVGAEWSGKGQNCVSRFNLSFHLLFGFVSIHYSLSQFQYSITGRAVKELMMFFEASVIDFRVRRLTWFSFLLLFVIVYYSDFDFVQPTWQIRYHVLRIIKF